MTGSVSPQRVISTLAIWGAFVGVPLMLTPSTAQAQWSVEGRYGTATISDLETGSSWALDVTFGHVKSRKVRPFLGFEGTSAGVSRDTFLGSLGGTVKGWGGRVGARFDPFMAGRFAPYGAVALLGQHTAVSSAGATADEYLEGLYGGFELGIDVMAGLTWAIDEEQRFAVIGALRKTLAAELDPWSVQVGLRYTPGGRASYEDLGSYSDDFDEFEPIPVPEPRAEERPDLAPEAIAVTAAVGADALQAERDSAQAAADRLAQQLAEAEAARGAAEAKSDSARALADTERLRANEAEARAAGMLMALERVLANITSIRETERGLVIVLGDGLFDVGRSDVSAGGHRDLRAIAAVLELYPERAIVLEGHTDATGSELFNERLSDARAESVAQALTAEGLESQRFVTRGFGESRPIADNDSAQGRALNRRVEIVILGAGLPSGG